MIRTDVISQLAAAVMQFSNGPTTAAEIPRYEAIVANALDVAFNPAEKPVYSGTSARMRTATLILAVAQLESNFDSRVESGAVRGDHGQSWCFMQVQLPFGQKAVATEMGFFSYAPRTSDMGWAGAELAESQTKCFTVGLHIARMSLTRCRNLSLYTTGKCMQKERYAHNREHRGESIWAKGRWVDTEVMEPEPVTVAIED